LKLTFRKCFLFQANSLAADLKGKTPIFSKVLKTASTVRGLIPGRRHTSSTNFANSVMYADQNAVMQEISRHHRRSCHTSLMENTSNAFQKTDDRDFTQEQMLIDENNENIADSNSNHSHSAKFAYIVIRPTTYLKDDPSIKKVSASKSVRFASLYFWRNDE
jgi:hypothetical protein